MMTITPDAITSKTGNYYHNQCNKYAAIAKDPLQLATERASIDERLKRYAPLHNALHLQAWIDDKALRRYEKHTKI